MIVSGLVGVVGNLSEALEFEFDFPTFVCQYTHQNRIMVGSISFVNSCRPNVSFKIHKSKMGIVRMVTLSNVAQGEEIYVRYGAKYFLHGDINTCQCPHSDLHAAKKSRSTKNSSRPLDSNRQQVSFSQEKQPLMSDQVHIDDGNSKNRVLPLMEQPGALVEDISISQNSIALARQSTGRPQRRVESYKTFWGNEQRQEFSLKCTICEENIDVADMMYHMKLHHRFEAQIPCPVCQHHFRFCQSFVRHFDKTFARYSKQSEDFSFGFGFQCCLGFTSSVNCTL